MVSVVRGSKAPQGLITTLPQFPEDQALLPSEGRLESGGSYAPAGNRYREKENWALPPRPERVSTTLPSTRTVSVQLASPAPQVEYWLTNTV